MDPSATLAGLPPLRTETSRVHPVRIRLGGHEPRTGEVVVSSRSLTERLVRTGLSLALWPVVCLLAFLIPPHGEPLFLAVAGGAYWVYRQWTTRYVVHSLRAPCPRCEQPLRLARRAPLSASMSLACLRCHFTPSLDLPSAAN